MNNEPLVVERIYNAPIDKVWKAITNLEQMRQWYFDSIDKFEPKVGFEFTFTGGDDKKIYKHVCRITEVVPNKKLVHTWTYPEDSQGVSEVKWELFDEGGKTRLKLTHTGIENFAHAGPSFVRSNFEGGWSEITGKLLKEFVEKN